MVRHEHLTAPYVTTVSDDLKKTPQKYKVRQLQKGGVTLTAFTQDPCLLLAACFQNLTKCLFVPKLNQNSLDFVGMMCKGCRMHLVHLMRQDGAMTERWLAVIISIIRKFIFSYDHWPTYSISVNIQRYWKCQCDFKVSDWFLFTLTSLQLYEEIHS